MFQRLAVLKMNQGGGVLPWGGAATEDGAVDPTPNMMLKDHVRLDRKGSPGANGPVHRMPLRSDCHGRRQKRRLGYGGDRSVAGGLGFRSELG